MTPFEPGRWVEARRTHPASPWLSLLEVRGAIGLVFFLAVIGQLRIVGIVAAVAVLGELLSWWRTSWSFDGTTLTFDDGILHRTYRRVPVGRVQQVEVHEPLVHRIAGMAVVRIETAGGAGSAEIVLDALDRGEATALQAEVLAARARALADSGSPSGRGDPSGGVAAVPSPPEALILRLEAPRIMLSGVLGSNLLVVFALMGGFFDLVSRLPRRLGDAVESEASELIGALGLVMGALALVALALVAAAIAAVVAHHDLTVVRRGDELRMRRGLLERRDAVVPLARVQAVTVAQNLAQRMFRLHSVSVRSAGSSEGGDVRLTIPAASRPEVDRIVAAAIGRQVDLMGLDPAPPAARTRRIVRRAFVLVTPAAVGMVSTSFATPAVAVASVAVVLALVMGLDAYRALGHRLDPDLLVTRSGSLVRRTAVVVRARTQSSRTSSTLFQRRHGLASLVVDLAGRGATPVVVDQDDELCAALSRVIETTPVSSGQVPYATLGSRPLPSNEES